jgi:hypothetical protein
MTPYAGRDEKESRRHLGGEILKHANGPGHEAIAKMAQRQVENPEMPFGHHLDKPTRLQALGFAPAHGRCRHFETPRRLSRNFGVHHVDEDDRRSEAWHRFSYSGKSFQSRPHYERRNPNCRFKDSMNASAEITAMISRSPQSQTVTYTNPKDPQSWSIVRPQ